MEPIKIFYSYAQEDEEFQQELEKHLSGLKRSQSITTWHDQLLPPGKNREQEINQHLESADIILLLLSSYFFKSQNYSSPVMIRTLERHNSGEVRIIPVLLRPVDLAEAPLAQLAVLPTGGTPITVWQERDEAFLNIVKGISTIVTAISIASLAKESHLSISNQDQQTKYQPPTKTLEFPKSDYGPDTIARLLQMRKTTNHRPLLILGSRAGGLFRNEHFYNVLKPFSNRSFEHMSRIEQFYTCYHILNSGNFSERDINTILKVSMIETDVDKVDTHLAEIVKQGYFDEIITTNIDDILEQSFLEVGMKESRDFEVSFLLHQLPVDYERSLPVRVIKLFGDLNSRVYSIGRRDYLIAANFLQSVLARDTLIVGFDPVWDEELLNLIPGGTGTIWFVNEEDQTMNPLVSGVLQHRSTDYITGSEGSYERFTTELFNNLGLDMHSSNNLQYQFNILQDQFNTLQGRFDVLQNYLQTLQEEKLQLLNTIADLQNKHQPTSNPE